MFCNILGLILLTFNRVQSYIVEYLIFLQISDQKLICNWLAKTDQKLTCSAVELETDAKFSAVINSQVNKMSR